MTVALRPRKAGTFEAGDRTYPILPWTSKTYTTQAVPLPAETVAVLQRWKLQTGGSAYVFLSLDRLAQIRAYLTTHDGKLPASYKLVNNLHRQFSLLQATAGCSGTTHDFRRTYGTLMAKLVPLHDLKRLMGHSNFQTTEAFYLGVSDDLDAKVADAFAAVA